MSTTMTAYRSILVMWVSVALGVPAPEHPFRFTPSGFHHDIYFSGDPYQRPHRLPAFLPFSVNSELGLKPTSLLTFQQESVAGNPFRRPAASPANLFTPNVEQQPAETPGQVENYRKALEEEAREAEREANAVTNDRHFGGGGAGAKSYVSVVFRKGDRNYDYSYTF